MRQWRSIYKRFSRVKKIIFWAIFCFISYLMIGFFIVPPIAKNIAVKKISEITGRSVFIEKVKLNPLILKVSVLGFSIKERDPNVDFISFSQFDVNFQASSLFKLAPVIKEVKLQTPFIRGVRCDGGSYNFTDILEKNTTGPMPQEDQPESEPFYFAVYNIEILNGGAEFIDETVNKTHRISDLHLGIPFISNLKEQIDVFVHPYFKANFNQTPIALSGRTKPFHDTLETALNLDLKKIDLPYYFAYAPQDTNLKIVSGSLDVNGKIYFLQKENEKPAIASEGELWVNNLVIEDIQGHPILDLPEFYTKWGRSQLIKRNIHIEKLRITHPEVGITHTNDSMINLFTLFPGDPEKSNPNVQPTPDETSPEEVFLKLDELLISEARIYLMDHYKVPEDKSPEKSDILNLHNLAAKNFLLEEKQTSVTLGEIMISGGDLTIRRQPSNEFNFQSVMAEPAKEEQNLSESKAKIDEPDNRDPWTVTLKTIDVEGFNILGENLAGDTKGDMSINALQINGKNISTQKEAKGNIDLKCKINQKATVEIKTKVKLTPVALTSEMEVADLELSWMQPFIEDNLNLIVKEGRFALTGSVAAALGETSKPDVSFNGDMMIEDFLVYDDAGIDKLIQLKKLGLEKIEAGYPEIHANLSAVRLSKLNSNIIRKRNGGLNLADIVVSREKDDTTTADSDNDKNINKEKASEAIRVAVEEFVVEESEVNFIDRSLSPYFKTALEQMQVKVKGLSSEADQRADVDFSAKVDGHAPLKISGKLNPLSKDIFADLDFDFKNMELSSVSPYSGKYVGKKIRKGKLSFDLAYLIEGSKLDASNQIFIDRIELGEDVESPDATNLPVGLGIALLKDPSGRINLDIPVQGDLSDPEFSLGGTILKVIVNLLTKAATSPFALLASMFGGGEDIDLIQFDPGMTLPRDSEVEKLDTVINAFLKRPALNLEIRGYTDGKADREMLVRIQFDRLLAAEKMKKKDKNDGRETSLEKVELTQKEYEKYLKTVYKNIKEDLEKAGDFKEPDDVTAAFMEETIKGRIQITDEDLKLLASQRALAVKDYLIGPEKIAAERIFLVEPDTLEPKSGESEVNRLVKLEIK